MNENDIIRLGKVKFRLKKKFPSEAMVENIVSQNLQIKVTQSFLFFKYLVCCYCFALKSANLNSSSRRTLLRLHHYSSSKTLLHESLESTQVGYLIFQRLPMVGTLTRGILRHPEQKTPIFLLYTGKK